MSHQIAGVGLAAVSAAALDATASTTAVLAASAWVGSLLPDADRASVRVYRPTPLERRGAGLRPLAAVARVPLRLLVVLPHRGLTHSLFGCAVMAAIASALTSLVAP